MRFDEQITTKIQYYVLYRICTNELLDSASKWMNYLMFFCLFVLFITIKIKTVFLLFTRLRLFPKMKGKKMHETDKILKKNYAV